MTDTRWLACCAILLLTAGAWADQPVSGDAVIRARAGESEIVITTTSRVAGAIHSLTWNGREFIDSHDHGRQLQSASNFDSGRDFIPEVFNPTEAGSMRDGAGPTSSSRLLKLRAEGHKLQTLTQMAFWLAPGENSLGHPARNNKVLSDHLLEKDVQVGFEDLPHAIQYDVTFTVPDGEYHTFAQFEALTGYMPAEFDSCYKVTASGKLEELDWGPGEQSRPVILSTASGSHAMGVYSPDQPSRGYERAGYGRFRFQAEQVNKWNCVFRARNKQGIESGAYKFRVFVAAGTLSIVTDTINSLHEKLAARPLAP